MAEAEADGPRQRKQVFETLEKSRFGTTATEKLTEERTEGDVRHTPVNPWTPLEVIRAIVFTASFLICSLVIHGSQLLGAPIYFFNKEWYYSWMAMTKSHFAIVLTAMTRVWSPTVIRVSGDASMDGQLHKTLDGRLECDFPERLVMIANHQIYTDWCYFWWVAYAAKMQGHIYIILKESLKWIPVIGPGMQFFSFIFMARKWENDKSRIVHRLQKLRTERRDDTGKTYRDPMWLLIFPEGTNLSANTRKRSVAWSEKSGIPDLKHALLPRSTGLQFCLAELKGSVEYIYDCTIAYETVPVGKYAQDIYTLRSVYFQGRAPKSVNMHWRRFRIADLPVDDEKAMSEWVLARWREKDELLETFVKDGKFPADERAISINTEKKETPASTEPVVDPMEVFQKTGKWPVKKAEPEKPKGRTIVAVAKPTKPTETYIETTVRPGAFYEIFEIFVPVVGAWMVGRNVLRFTNLWSHGKYKLKV